MPIEGKELSNSSNNFFINFHKNIEEYILAIGCNDEEKEEIISIFQEQFSHIDEKSYKMLTQKAEEIESHFNHILEEEKSESEFAELVNNSFFKTILEDIKRQDKNIESVKIFNTYPYIDYTQGIDYTVFIKYKNGKKINFGLDLKNDFEAEKHHNTAEIKKKFILITTDSDGNSLSYNEIDKILKTNSPIKQQFNKYEVGISRYNQLKINKMIIAGLSLGNKDLVDKEDKIYNKTKAYIEKIIDKEKKGGADELIVSCSDDVANILDLTNQQQEIKKQQKEAKVRREFLIKNEEKIRQALKENENIQKELSQIQEKIKEQKDFNKKYEKILEIIKQDNIRYKNIIIDEYFDSVEGKNGPKKGITKKLYELFYRDFYSKIEETNDKKYIFREGDIIVRMSQEDKSLFDVYREELQKICYKLKCNSVL